jgi:hypothetical protein
MVEDLRSMVCAGSAIGRAEIPGPAARRRRPNRQTRRLMDEADPRPTVLQAGA